MSVSESRSAVVLRLAEEFLERYRQGERPPLKEYIDRHPELAAEIKEVFPAMALTENVARADESLDGTARVPATPVESLPPQLLPATAKASTRTTLWVSPLLANWLAASS